MSPSERFVDRGELLAHFARECLAICPKCAGPLVVAADSDRIHPFDASRSKATCLKCAFRATGNQTQWSGPVEGNANKPVRFGGPYDPFFGFPLWLQMPCCGETFWAFNREHLSRLRRICVCDAPPEARFRAGASFALVSLFPIAQVGDCSQESRRRSRLYQQARRDDAERLLNFIGSQAATFSEDAGVSPPSMRRSKMSRPTWRPF